jgi:hypothetical protein
MIHTFDKKHPMFENLSFVARAAAKRDDLKPHLEQINVTEQHVQATNGDRAHRFSPVDMPLMPGMYRILKRTKSVLELAEVETDTDYPDFSRVIPRDPVVGGFPPGDVDLKYATVIRAMPDAKAYLNHAYFADVFPSSVSGYAVTDGFSPVYLRGDRIEAIIMPARQAKD